MSLCLLITTINRSPQLEKSLERLCELTLPDEVLVVDDGGEDGCDNTCRQFEGRLPIRYIYTHNPGISICSHARNVGLKNTSCDLIMTSEPECYFVSDVVAQCRETWHEHPGLVCTAGTVHHNDMEPERVTVGWSATYTALWGWREQMLALGGWDEHFPGVWGFDDIDMLTRMRLAGFNQIIKPEIEILHQFHENTGHKLGAANGLAENDVYFKGKGLDFGDENIVANRGHEWGEIKSR